MIVMEEQKKVYSYIKASKTFNLNIYQDIQNVVNFNTVYKKINETQDIKSIAIRTTPKFKKYNTIFYELVHNAYA